MLLMASAAPSATDQQAVPPPPIRHRPPPSPQRPVGDPAGAHQELNQGLARSFRFPSLSSLSRRKMGPSSTSTSVPPRPPHYDLSEWLAILELTEYAENFASFSGVEDLISLSEADIKDLGVRNSAHRARIMSSLVALRTKYEKGTRRRGGDKLQRHSVAVDSGRLVDHSLNSDLLLRVNETTPQSKSLDNLMMDGGDGGEAAAAAALRKALEWELSLDTRDLRSHAWYHGAIPRPRAEEITTQDGHFLVRDCTSQPGDYVLSCRSRGQPLHFVINKVVIQPDTVYERVQYQFEDEAFDTVPDLITYYVGNAKCISVLSGARIHTPRNRLYPLSFYASKYTLQHQQYQQYCGVVPQPSVTSPSAGTARNVYSNNMVVTTPPPMLSPPPLLRSNKPPPPPRLPTKQHRSQSLTAADGQGNGQALMEERGSSADGMVQSNDAGSKFSTHSLPRHHLSSRTPTSGATTSTMPRSNNKIVRVTSDPTLSPCMERRRFGYLEDGDPPSSTPPPKPSRLPSLIGGEGIPSTPTTVLAPRGVYHASGSDSGNGSGDSVQSSADNADALSVSMQRCSVGVIIKNPSRSYSPPESVEPELEPASAFDLDNFSTLLLPTLENKPLDSTALQGVKLMLLETGPRVIANHLTKVDLELAHGAGASNTSLQAPPDLGLGVTSGIELCSLPHGHQLRIDLIERTRCLQLFVAVTVLSGNSETERAETLHRWIQVAVDTKTALGNLFGFCAVMMGLCMPPIQRLSSTWHVLRQRFTDSAYSFEAKLRPVLKSMNECTNPQAPNTTIPHLLPYLLLQERSEALTCEDDAVYPSPTCWESSSPDLGLGTLFEHLQTARKFTDSESMFRRNAEIVLGEAKLDDLLIDAFRTEFHLKFLWGSRGAYVSAPDRHAKFLQVLSAMSEKCESSYNVQSPCQQQQPATPSAIPQQGTTHTAV